MKGINYNQVYYTSKRNALKRAIPFNLTLEQFQGLVRRSGGHCMVSGLPFSDKAVKGATRRPFMPSLDRVNSSGGYTLKNCRLVSVCVNLAMNEWGLETLLSVSKALVSHQAKLSRTGQVEEDEHCSIDTFLSRKGLVLSKSERQSFGLGLTFHCRREGIESSRLVLPTGKTRVDGSVITKTVPGFSVSTMEAVFAVRFPHLVKG